MTRKKVSKKTLSLWHGRLGILSSLFVLLLATTGLLINHAHDLKLDSASIQNTALLSLYGIKLPPLKAVQVEGKWLVWQGQELYLDGAQLLECKGKFVGAITLPHYWVAACEGDLLVFTYEQELLERVGESAGIHYPISQIGACESLLCYQNKKQIYQLDIETLVITKFNESEGHALQWSAPTTPPKKEALKVRRYFHAGELTWERLLLDVHAGRFLGRFGPWFMDAVALLFIILAISGAVVWSRRNGAKKKST